MPLFLMGGTLCSRAFIARGLFLLATAFVLPASADSLDDLFALSLEELNQVEVSVGSRKAQSIIKTPGVVRVFTAVDIQKSGFETLQDVLRHVPGVQLSESKNGHSNIWMRGVQGRNNNKVLLLLDGVPQHDNFYGNFNIGVMLPMTYVERIEILNGPGGVTYGANGFAGIISITSKNQGRVLSATHGTQTSYRAADQEEQVGLYRYSGQADFQQGEHGHWYVFADYYKEDGFQPQYNRKGEFYERDTESKNSFLSLRYSNRGFSAILQATDYRYPYRYTSAGRWQGYEKKPLSLALSYEGALAQHRLSSHFYARQFDFSRPHQRYDDTRSVTSNRDTNYDSSMVGGEAIVHWDMPIDHGLDLGVAYQHDWLRESIEVRTDYDDGDVTLERQRDQLVDKPNRENFGVFIQYQWDAGDYANFTVGARHDHLTDFDDEFSYRIGLTGAKANLYYKLLYGTSFRVPTYREYLKKYSPEYDSINPLEAEHIETLELSLGYGKNYWRTELTLYQNQYQDFIKEVNVNSVGDVVVDDGSGGDEYGFNFEETRVQGAELSFELNPLDELSVSATVSKLFSAEETPGSLPQNVTSPEPIISDVTPLLQLSDITASLKLTYQPSEQWVIGTEVSYYSDRDVSDAYQTGSQVQNPHNANAVMLVGAHAQLQLAGGLTFKLKVDNVFDDDISSPNFDHSSEYDVQWPRRKAALSVYWSY